MDRRKFLKGSVIGALHIPAVGVAATHIYGNPGSLSPEIAKGMLDKNELYLSLSNIGIPKNVRAEMTKFTSLCHEVITNKAMSEALRQDPAGVLKQFGLSPDDIGTGTGELEVLRALGDEQARDLALRGDAEQFLVRLDELGVARSIKRPSTMADRLMKMVDMDRERFQEAFDGIRQKLDKKIDVDFANEELAFIAGELRELTPMCSVFAAVCVSYALAVFSTAAAVVSVVVAGTTAVVGTIAATKVVVFGDSQLPQAQMPREEMAGRLMAVVDDERYNDYGTAIKFARLTDNQELEHRLKAKVLGEEMEGVLSIIDKLYNISIPEVTRERIRTALVSLAHRSLVAAER